MAPLLLLYCLLILSRNCVYSQELFLGKFRQILHDVGGKAYAISERVIEVREFEYDGQGPAVYFWLDKDMNPSSYGIGLTSPQNVPSCGMKIGLAATGSKTFTIELPEGQTLTSYAGGSLSVWCKTFGISFGELTLPNNMEGLPVTDEVTLACASREHGKTPGNYTSTAGDVVVPEIAKTPERYNCEPLDEDLQVRWRVAGAAIEYELVGRIQDGDYMAFGLSGSKENLQMLGGDAVVSYYDGLAYKVDDIYLSSRSQCNQGIGVCPDEEYQFGGNALNDAFGVKGRSQHGLTKISYVRALKATDASLLAAGRPIDQILKIEEESSIIWAIGPMNLETGLPGFHRKIPPEKMGIRFGRPVEDNCEPLVTIDAPPVVQTEVPSGSTSVSPTQAPFLVPEQNPFGQRLIRSTTTDLYARIGYFGGEAKGYPAITGRTGWGLAWYINDKLVPIINMERGKTYRFHVNGGDNTDPSQAASYHPFYLTSSVRGGYAQLNATERAKEKIFGGISFEHPNPQNKNTSPTETGSFLATAVGPLCQYKATDETHRVLLHNPDVTYRRYFETLNRSCANNATITEKAGMLEFTPDENTPGTIYYQCVTHRNLGWKIRVRNPPARPPLTEPTPDTDSPTIQPSSTPTDAPKRYSPTPAPSSEDITTPDGDLTFGVPTAGPFFQTSGARTDTDRPMWTHTVLLSCFTSSLFFTLIL